MQLLISALLLPLGSCSLRERSRTIALITPLTTSELWKGIHAGVYRACKEDGANLYWNGPTHEGDTERQIELLERQVAKRVTGIVLAPAHASALIPAVAEAVNAGIPVVIAGDQLAAAQSRGIATVRSDDALAGRMAADFIAHLLHGRGEVAIVGIDASSSSHLARSTAFEQRVEASYPGMRVVLKTFETPGSILEEEADPEQLIAQHPQLGAIFTPTINGLHDTYAVLQQQGSLHRIHLVGCDQDADAFEPLRRGEIDAIMGQNVFAIGYAAAHMLLQHSLKQTPLTNTLVAPILLTRDNVTDPATQHLLRPYAGFDR